MNGVTVTGPPRIKTCELCGHPLQLTLEVFVHGDPAAKRFCPPCFNGDNGE